MTSVKKEAVGKIWERWRRRWNGMVGDISSSKVAVKLLRSMSPDFWKYVLGKQHE